MHKEALSFISRAGMVNTQDMARHLHTSPDMALMILEQLARLGRIEEFSCGSQSNEKSGGKCGGCLGNKERHFVAAHYEKPEGCQNHH
ncbi:FeoC-like transcriptional regulator [Polycladidibacter hongkongensis]|uniref:FeoC-like transcriptional regulator n=1 Tax=Polycladidibacter hongkongensis TaxID=1647556 RepID=UPI00082B3391|nr:FeoC-like transcriptional regulator [Pseudovibrio hongkongensis]